MGSDSATVLRTIGRRADDPHGATVSVIRGGAEPCAMVGVYNAPPVYSLGLSDAFRATEMRIEEVHDLEPWLVEHERSMLIWLIRSTDELDDVARTTGRAGGAAEVAVIAVLDPMTCDAAASAVHCGARGVIGVDESPDDVVLAVRAAARNRTILPADVVRRLVQSTTCGPELGRLDEEDRAWLTALAAGEKVADLARRLGYSEREMYRRLRKLYARMNVHSRTGALLVAARAGLIG